MTTGVIFVRNNWLRLSAMPFRGRATRGVGRSPPSHSDFTNQIGPLR